LAMRALAAVAVLSAAARAAEGWKPADGPLKTRWTKRVSATRALAEYPRPQLARKDWMSLNGLWDLRIGEERRARKILVPYPPESALSGVMRHGEHLVYRRTFEVPKEWRDRRVILN